MNAPIIFDKDLTPNPDHARLEPLINAMPEGEYRKQYEAYKAGIVTSARKQGFTKAEAARIAHNLINTYLVYPYLEEKTDRALYDLDYIQLNIEFYKTASREFFLSYWGTHG